MAETKRKGWQIYLLLVGAPVLLFVSTTIMIFIVFGFPPANIDNQALVDHLTVPIMVTEWILVLVVFALLRFRSEEIISLGFSSQRWWLEVLLGVIVFLILIPLMKYGIYPLLRMLRLPSGPGAAHDITFEKIGLLSVLASFTAAFCEETIWRGWAQRNLSRLHGSLPIAVFISAVFFGFFHWGQGLSGIVSTFVWGLMLGGIVVWRKNLWAVMVIHFLADFL